jgi:hypothetical protein
MVEVLRAANYTAFRMTRSESGSIKIKKETLNAERAEFAEKRKAYHRGNRGPQR